MHFHFIGICGTAMGSAAVALSRQGHRISGSDAQIYPPMSEVLREAGIALSEGYGPQNLPQDADCFVVGNAISRGNPELEALLEQHLPYTSLPELLRMEVLRKTRNFIVSGTHGKTTTTSMLTWLLHEAGRNPGYLIGGVTHNLPQSAHFGDGRDFVIEGDEYDSAFFDKRSKFLHYLPDTVIVNNIEFDHADIFRNLDEILLTFQRLLLLVPRNGLIILNGDDPNCRSLHCPAPSVKVGLGAECDQRIELREMSEHGSRFSLNGELFDLPMIGEFNVRNAAMAIVAARHAGVSDEIIRRALPAFKGVLRRQSLRGEQRGVTVIDDFGHHPTAIGQTLQGMRQRYPGRRLWAVFEPRSNTSRRKVLQDPLIEALSQADCSIVAAVANPQKVPAGQLLEVDAVAASVSARGRACFHEPSTEAIIDRLGREARPGDVVVIFSNGGFDGIHERLLDRLAAA